MLGCKEGDLAVILNGAYTGYVVTVGGFLGSVIATVRSTGKDVLVPKAWYIHGIEGVNCEEDSYLQPIRPAPSGIKTETEKEITA